MTQVRKKKIHTRHELVCAVARFGFSIFISNGSDFNYGIIRCLPIISLSYWMTAIEVELKAHLNRLQSDDNLLVTVSIREIRLP